ncbi:ATP-binding protein [Lutispora saccharofermentans]|uniref:ATP-binding protein n=1 Tax=Lutispora saccharofermentans TaxID=3024236 RepID=A0ABT1NEA5_9FIRM|nr:ATP-binding protein [Lutispora saccharofermentans]MCQ1528681.1 ATP-binding protein [Lutispora saccharofermentans]
MKQLLILSGKGGTGKTTVAGAFIKLAGKKAFADCDVDAPNLHIIYSDGEIKEEKPYYGLKKAVKNYDICIQCGKCEELCRFSAIRNGILKPMECEGCGVCEAFCPVKDDKGKKAIHLEKNISGITTVSAINGEIFSQAQLRTGNGASGKLVTEVRKNLKNFAADEEFAIIDGSPGIGCPVIASITGVDLVLIVAEPTISGIHDMKRIIETAERFGVPCLICINKYDVNTDKAYEIEEFCNQESISLIGRIPFDASVVKAVNQCKTVMDMPDSPAADALRGIWEEIYKVLTS